MNPPRCADRVELFADRDAWLAARHARPGQIGASEVSAILGISPHKGPWDVYAAAKEGRPLEIPDERAPEVEEDPDAAEDPSDPLVRGNLWEPFVRELAGKYLAPRQVVAPGVPFGQPAALAIVRHPVLPWLGASPDAWLTDTDGEICPKEIKTDALRRGWAWGRSGSVIGEYTDGSEAILPPHYYTQVSIQLACCDAPRAYLFVLQGSYRARWFCIERDIPTEAKLLRAVAAWRERHIVRGIEPDRDASDACAAAYRAKYAAKGGVARRATDEEAAMIATIADHKRTEKAAKLARVDLLASMGDAANCLTIEPAGGKSRGVRRNSRGILSSFNLD